MIQTKTSPLLLLENVPKNAKLNRFSKIIRTLNVFTWLHNAATPNGGHLESTIIEFPLQLSKIRTTLIKKIKVLKQFQQSLICVNFLCRVLKRQLGFDAASDHGLLNRALKQLQRRRLQKRHLKGKFALSQNLSRLFYLVQFVKCRQIFLELISNGLVDEKESCCLLFTSSTNREIRHFHVVGVQWRQRNVQKAWCTCKVVFCQSKPVAVLPCSLLLPSSFLKLKSEFESHL